MNYDCMKFELSSFSRQGRIYDYPNRVTVGKVERAFRQGQLSLTLKLRNAKLIDRRAIGCTNMQACISLSFPSPHGGGVIKGSGEGEGNQRGK